MKATTAQTTQRQALIPKIAKTLSGVKLLRSHIGELAAEDQFEQHVEWSYRSHEWIEQKLWLSLTQAPGSDVRITDTVLGSYEAWKKANSRILRENLPTHPSNEPIRNRKVNLCHEFTSTAGANPYPGITIADTAEGSPQTAGKRYINPFESMHRDSTSNAGGITFDAELTGDERHAHALPHTPANDHCSKASSEIDMLEDIIGQKQLIHNQQSTFSYWHDQHHDLFENIGIYDNCRPVEHSSIGNTITAPANWDSNTLNLNQDISLTVPSTTSTAIPYTMNSQYAGQSLSELLGDDARLANMWSRRRSACTTGEDDAEMLHDMFLHDPDMKLFSPSSKASSFADTMIFDDCDFSRCSSRSSASSTQTSSPRNSFEQLEPIAPSTYVARSSSSSSTTALPSNRDIKDYDRHSSSSRHSSLSSKMLEHEILFQQTRKSRSAEAKQRKTSRH